MSTRVMRHLSALPMGRGLRRADIHVAIDLAAVGSDDFRPGCAGPVSSPAQSFRQPSVRLWQSTAQKRPGRDRASQTRGHLHFRIHRITSCPSVQVSARLGHLTPLPYMDLTGSNCSDLCDTVVNCQVRLSPLAVPLSRRFHNVGE